MSSHPNESNEGSRICAKAVDFETSIPVAEPVTLKGCSYSHDFVPNGARTVLRPRRIAGI